MNKKCKILLVEDEKNILEIYEKKLELAGYDVIKASTGAEGLSLAQLEKPKIILLDILMPEADGYQMLQGIKKNETTKNITVIIFSNLSQKEEIEKGLKLGAKDYIIKTSVTPAEMVEKVNEYFKK